MNKTILSQTDYAKSSESIQSVIDNLTSEHNLAMRKMTHEINNALTLINSSLQIIESSHPEVKHFKYWDSTMDDIQYLISLVSEISFFNNSNSLSPEATDIIALIYTIIHSFKVYENANTVDISLKVINPNPTILSDKVKLKQILINLIKNAYEALDKDKPDSYIHIILDYNNESLFIHIQDNGCGMTSEQMENIFTPMISYKSNGNGLGLPISRKIIEAHGGTLTVTSSPNIGSDFTITLPV